MLFGTIWGRRKASGGEELDSAAWRVLPGPLGEAAPPRYHPGNLFKKKNGRAYERSYGRAQATGGWALGGGEVRAAFSAGGHFTDAAPIVCAVPRRPTRDNLGGRGTKEPYKEGLRGV